MKTLNNLISIYSKTNDEDLLPIIESLSKQINLKSFTRLSEGRCTITLIKSKANQ